VKRYSLMTGHFRTVHLIDTPGIDYYFDPNATKVFEMIFEFIRASSLPGLTLDGIIFLHPINSMRIPSGFMRTLRAFTQLVERPFNYSVILATTMWDQVAQDIGEKRQSELCSSSGIWDSIVQRRCRVTPLPRDRQSALALLDNFVRPDVKSGLTAVGEGETLSGFADEDSIEITLRELRDEGNGMTEALSRKWKYLARLSHQLMIPPSSSPTSLNSGRSDNEDYFRKRREVKADLGSGVSEYFKNLQEVSGGKVKLTKQLRQLKEQLNEKIALIAASSAKSTTMNEILFLINAFALGYFLTV
jgi:hypothetical protein